MQGSIENHTAYSSKPSLDLLNLEDQFIDQLRGAGRSLNTLKNYRTDLECFNQYLKNKKESLDISDFTIAQVEQYGNFLQEKYNSDNSRRRRVQALRIFFDFLVEKQLFDSNPVRKLPTSPKFLDIPRPTPFIDVKTLWVYLLEEEQNPSVMSRLIAKRNQVAFLLIYGAGLKVSDLATLKKDHIFMGEETRVLVHHPKRDPYTIALPEIFPFVYNEYIELLEKQKVESKIDFENLLFNANPYKILSGGLSPRGLEIIFEELRNKLMLTLTPKSLRQACIFKWLHQGHNDSLIKEWMGVAPSYSLKLYKDHLDKYIYNDDFLLELYRNHKMNQ